MRYVTATQAREANEEEYPEDNPCHPNHDPRVADAWKGDEKDRPLNVPGRVNSALLKENERMASIMLLSDMDKLRERAEKAEKERDEYKKSIHELVKDIMKYRQDLGLYTPPDSQLE